MAVSRAQLPQPPRMSKSQALERVRQLKQQIVIGSIVAFAAFIGLISGRISGLLAALSQQGDNSPALQQNQNNGFFDQGGQYNSGGSNVSSQPGYSPPVTGSGTS